MTDFIIKKLPYDLTSNAGLALVGQIKQLFFCKFHELVLRRCAHAAGQGFIVR